MVLINLKLKTLDTNSDHIISIDDETKLLNFREEIERTVSVPKDRQRLIFRGRVLSDDEKSLRSFGLEDQFAVHLVTRPPESERIRHSAQPDRSNVESGGEHNAHQQLQGPLASVINSHLVIGNVPFERTGIFTQPDDALQLVTSQLSHLESGFRLQAQPTLALNRPNQDDFSINIILRGIRDEHVNSPARERFEHLKFELRRLAWTVAVIRSFFGPSLDQLLLGSDVPSREESYRIISEILSAMHHIDYMNEAALRHIQLNHDIQDLVDIIDQIVAFNLEEDDAHEHRINPRIIMRYCTTSDISNLMQFVSRIEEQINLHVFSRYLGVLSFPGNAEHDEVSSYTARLINCFSTAFSRIQHQRSHIYHVISDFGLHADNNPMQRVYPQYITYNRMDEPIIADLSLLFYHPRNSDRSHASFINAIDSGIDNRGPRSVVGSPGNINSPLPSTDSNSRSSFTVTFSTHGEAPNLGATSLSRSETELMDHQSTATSSQTDGVATNGQQNRTSHANSSTSTSESTEQGSHEAHSSIHSFLTNFMQSIGNSFLGNGSHSGAAAVSTPTTGQQSSQGSQGQQGQPPQTTSIMFSSLSTTQPFQQQSAIRIGANPIAAGALSSVAGAGARLFPNRMILRPVRPAQFRQQRLQQQQQQIGERNALPPSRLTFIRSVPYSAASSGDGGGMRRTILFGSGQDRPPRALPRPRSVSPIIRGSGGRRIGVERGIQLSALQQLSSPDHMHWGQIPPSANNVLFVGPNPPNNFPIYTHDTFLSCSSRRWRMFELDARHGDFWNDPVTISLGLRPPHHNTLARTTSSSEPSLTTSSSVENPGIDQPSVPAFGTNPLVSDGMDVRANNNGELVFTELNDFQTFVRRILDSIARCMVDIDRNISLEHRRDQQTSFNANSTVYGFMPLDNVRPNISAAFEFTDGDSVEMVAELALPLLQRSQEESNTTPENTTSRNAASDIVTAVNQDPTHDRPSSSNRSQEHNEDIVESRYESTNDSNMDEPME